MEPNDKLLKEKLEAYQAPFDAAAWQGMEQLLQQKKKRRFLVWWWWLGTSLAAAIAVISLLLLTPKENAIGSNPAIATANSYNHKNFTENTTHNTYSTTRSTDAKTPVTTTTQAEQQHSTIQQSNTTETIAPHSHFTAFNGKKNHTKALRKALAASPKAQPHQSQLPIYTTPTTQAPYTTLNGLAATELSTQNTALELQQNEQNESVQLPVKKKKYRYELGINSGSFAVATGNNFHTKPSWFLGIQEAYRFGKYFAFTDGFYYSRTSLRQQFSLADSGIGLKHYETNFHTVSLALGVQVYPISTKKIDWYIGAGIFNNFKIKERIEYTINAQKVTEDQLTGNPPTVGTMNVGNKSNTVAETELQKGYGTKIYTLNVYTSTGIETSLYKGLRMNMGIQYQLGALKSIDKISHPHFIGAELGLRYRF